MAKDNHDRLKELDDRLKLAIKEEKQSETPETSRKRNDLGNGLRIGMEMVVSVIAGGGLGLLIDKATDSATRPTITPPTVATKIRLGTGVNGMFSKAGLFKTKK